MKVKESSKESSNHEIEMNICDTISVYIQYEEEKWIEEIFY